MIRGFLGQALDHGVFHADLHEGNLFVEAPARLHAIDFGIVGRLGADESVASSPRSCGGSCAATTGASPKCTSRRATFPRVHGVDDFAQALRAVGEPIFGRPAREVSMGRLLGQLFEITGLFDMHLRPELVMLQKTMATVEGVARRIDPDSDIWEAARPIVQRWIARELSPVARVRGTIATRGWRAVAALEALVARGENEAAAVSFPASRTAAVAWMALGAALSALVMPVRPLWRLVIADALKTPRPLRERKMRRLISRGARRFHGGGWTHIPTAPTRRAVLLAAAVAGDARVSPKGSPPGSTTTGDAALQAACSTRCSRNRCG